jgi:predicted TIM-barrel fold metal-dependent hydrolase
MEFAEKRGRDKVLFAGYFPWITYERTFSELDEHIRLSDEVYRRFLFQNAVEVYGLHDLVEADTSATGGRSGV